MQQESIKDVIIIGGGQSALACAYFLSRRTKLDFLLLDDQEKCGGSWLKTWDSLTLFSPAKYSSLPGWMMPENKQQTYPSRDEVIDYLCKYEKRYKIPVERPVEVNQVDKVESIFKVQSEEKTFRARCVISATGTWRKPFIPEIDGFEKFKGKSIHSAHYRNPLAFKGMRVLVVGEGNSGAQILADLSPYATAVWGVKNAPEYLPDDVDGSVLFNLATAKYHAQQKGETFDATKYNLGNIVMVPSVKKARERGDLKAKGRIQSFHEKGVFWEDGAKSEFDAVIWCTGFGYATQHLEKLLSSDTKGKAATNGTRSKEVSGLWLVGYGGWTGYASATMMGVGRTAKKTVEEIKAFLG